MPGWSTNDMADQRGKRFIVTGATAGLGLETALALALKGADVVLVGRDAARGAAAEARIKAGGGAGARFEMCDLASLASVAEFARRLLAEDVPLDGLINNAGVMALPSRLETQDGFERQFGVNYLSHFALTARLLPLLRRARAPRIVNLSSLAHRRGAIHFGDLQFAAYDKWAAYQQSKLAMLMFTLELQRRSDAAGAGLSCLAAHPGWASTEIFGLEPDSSQGRGALMEMGFAVFRFFAQSAAEGALPTLYAATSPDARAGGYIGPGGWGEIKGAPAPAKIFPQALDRGAAERLWHCAEELTGVAFDWRAAH